MLTVCKASTVHTAADYVLSAIREGEGKNVVIAPDSFTLAVEMSVAEKLKKAGTFEVEVMSFARLASVVLGKKIRQCLSPSGSVMLMEKVISEKEEALRIYRRAARKAGFASEVYAAITAIRNSGVEAQDLRRAAESLQGYVKDKTLDIALLYEAYLEELNLRHTDSTTRLEALIREIEESESFGDVNFFVVDHVDFNAKQLGVLVALMKRAKSLCVAVADPAGQGNRRIYPRVLTKLRRAAEQEGIPMEEISVPDRLVGGKKTLSEELFSYGFSSDHTEDILLAEGKDYTEEVTFLATDITRLVRKEGLRYRDIAVITPSFEEYLPYLERIFSLYEIPFFSDARYPLSGSDVFKHLLCAFEIATSSFERTKVRKYVAHALFDGVTEEEKALFFDYLDLSGANGDAFREPFELYLDRPEYPAAEKVRQCLFRECGGVDALPSKGDFRFYISAFRSFLSENDFDGKIALYAERVFGAGLRKEAELIRRTPAAFMDLLSTLEDLRGEEQTTCRDFLLALTAGAEQVKLAALPVSLDCVYFAPVERAMYAPIPALFVLGAEEGIFPLERVKEGILGEKEYVAWQRRDIVIENTGVEELCASRFHALQLLLRGEKLYMTHRSSFAASTCMKQIAEIFSLDVKKTSDLLASYPIEVRIPTRKVAEHCLVEYTRRSREGLLTPKERSFALCCAELLGKPFPLPEEAPIPMALSEKVFFRTGETAVSEIENYYRCPFLHFVRYGLKAKEKELAVHDNRDIGNIAHECMCRFVEGLMASKEGAEISDEEARRQAEVIAREILSRPKYRAIAKNEGERILSKEIRHCREIAVRVKNQIASSLFRPLYLEKGFGRREKYASDGEGFPPLAIGDILLRGTIDRVDVLEKTEGDERARYAVAIDYKTGDHEVKTTELFFGEKVQLHLYLSVLRQAGLLPVAALYADLRDRLKSKDSSFFFGPILDNPYFTKAIDEPNEEGKGKYTGLVYDKEGCLKPLKDRTMTQEELLALLRYAEMVSEHAVSEIESGFICPSSLDKGQFGACKGCIARNICRGADRYPRPLRTVTADDVLRVMTGEKND